MLKRFGRGKLLQFRRTKIIATLGPASSTPEMLDALIGAGVDVFRMNFSHGSHEGHRLAFKMLKEAIKRSGRNVGIMGDLCGPKIRVGRFKGGSILLLNGSGVIVTVREVEGEEGLIPCEYKYLAKDVKEGDRLLLADGTRELKVLRVEGEDIYCEVIRGGVLSDRKGINLPGVEVSSPSFTEKDKLDAGLAVELGLDFIAMSFVRKAEDIAVLKQFLRQSGADIPVIAKIEKPEALECIEEIYDISDGIMVARGDLGIEMAAEEVPLIQREMTRLGVEYNKPVIIATQMLESMIGSGMATRAEITDVAWAAMAGADAVMLSGETAVGVYPVEAVKTMDKVVRMIETTQWREDRFSSLVHHSELADQSRDVSLRLLEGLSRSAATMCRELNAMAICVCALTGLTARMISAERPASPIIVLSNLENVCARLSLYWGIVPVYASEEVVMNPEKYVDSVLEKLQYSRSENGIGRRNVILVSLRDFDSVLSPTLRVI